MASNNLKWQSQAILLLVLPAAAAEMALQALRWAEPAPAIVVSALGLSVLLGLIAWKLHSATPPGAVAGTILMASLMLDSATPSSLPWQTALAPVLTLLILTSLATRMGRKHKEQLGTAEHRTGRAAAQVTANLGAAALLCTSTAQILTADTPWLRASGWPSGLLYVPMLAALCEAAADTASSELGQVLDSRPRMITSLRIAAPGTDGAISLGGTLAGAFAAGIVAAVGTCALQGGRGLFVICWVSGIFGLLFDSLLGATCERRGWLNNDAVNFLSTLSAAACALALLALAPCFGLL